MKGFTEQELREIVSWLSDEAAEMTVDREFIIEARGFDFADTLKRLRSVVESWRKDRPERVTVKVLTMCDGYRPLRDANKLLKAEGLKLRYCKEDCEGDQRMLWLEKLP